VIGSPEMAALVPSLLSAIADPNEATKVRVNVFVGVGWGWDMGGGGGAWGDQMTKLNLEA